MRISDWSSDVCSSDLSRRGSALCAEQRCVERCLRAGQAGDHGRHIVIDRLGQSGAARSVHWQRPQHQRVTDGAAVGNRTFCRARNAHVDRSEEHTSELQSLMRISYAVLCLKKKIQTLMRNTYDVTGIKKKKKKH